MNTASYYGDELSRLDFFVDSATQPACQPETEIKQENTKENTKTKRSRKRPRTSKTDTEDEEEDDESVETEDSRALRERFNELKQDPKFFMPSSQASTPSINFSRDELLTMSSEDFESNVARLSALRPLTAAEKNLIKRQRRLIKNRESAQASRQRKKDYVGELELKVDSLVGGNARLKEDFASLLTENSSLKNEVEFLSQLVRRIKVF